MEKIKIGINGFGRIGRRLLRLLEDHPTIEVCAINDIADGYTLSHLFKYDSIHGIFKGSVEFVEYKEIKSKNFLIINGKSIELFNQKKISKIPWNSYEIDVVVECSGKFKERSSLEEHLKAGAKKVILSVPSDDDSIKTVVLGVNEHILTGEEKIISNASCTTNNAAPMIKIVKDLCGVKQAYITTVHSYTTDQSLHDQPHHDLRRARAAGQSIVPTTTGAAKALTKIFPDLANVIGGCGIRVPVANGSLTDVTLNVERDTTIEEVNNAFKNAAFSSLKGILEYTEVPLVSIDIVGNPHSCILDSQMTSVIGNLVKLIGWYDNESGYSSRLIDLIYYVCPRS
ncbi:MAG: type I glyceraldehyde-3-phosphate dehydrogenase [Leeuwenhoekiella sp.]